MHMSQMLTRIFALFTLVTYLVVGTVAVRLFNSDSTEITLSTNYFSLFTSSTLGEADISPLAAPEMHFAEMKFEMEKRPLVRMEKAVVKNQIAIEKIVPEVNEVSVQLAKHELPFHEPIKLQKIEFTPELMTNLMALYKAVPIEERVLVASA